MKLLKQNHVLHGLAMCGLIAGCLALMELTGQNSTFDDKSPLQAIFMMIAPAIIWYMGIYARRKQQKNKITFKQAFNEGFKISLVYALVSPFIFLAYYVLINHKILESVRSTYGLTGAPDITVILVDMAAQFVAAMIFGALYAAIIAFFLKSKKKK